MNYINLLPARHRARLHANILLRRWIAASITYAAFLTIAVLLGHALFTIDNHSVALEIQRVQTESAQLEKVHDASLAQLKGVQAEASLRDAVNAPPDFAVLLSAIAQSCGDDAILTSLRWENVAAPQAISTGIVQAAPGQPAASVDPLAGLVGVKLELSGLARAQPAVGQFVQRLQDTALFDDVRLTKTSREGFLSGDALAFHVSSIIDPAGRRRTLP